MLRITRVIKNLPSRYPDFSRSILKCCYLHAGAVGVSGWDGNTKIKNQRHQS